MPAVAPDGAFQPAGEDALVVRPFRGVRFNPSAIRDLGAVTSPPYDVVDAEAARHLAALHPYNVVRLILPRNEAGTAPNRYRDAALTLAHWQANQILIRENLPALYVYEQHVEGSTQRGLLACVALRAAEQRVILPHEDVMPGPVGDRLQLMRTTGANFEPILLVYDGDNATADQLAAATASAPEVAATTEDGVEHKLWVVADVDGIGSLVAALARRQALIADGHHRYAAYLALQAEHRAAGDGRGPWDYGLALLVDNRTSPLHLGAIWRVVEGLTLHDALRAATPVFATQVSYGSLSAALAGLMSAADPHPVLVTDSVHFTVLAAPDAGAVARALGPAESGGSAAPLDVSVLHGLLLERVWQVPDGSGRIRYVHDAEGALRAARTTGGVALLTRPVDVSDVVEMAASGRRMPRKSTSFGPKPRNGFVLRLLDAD